MGRLLLEVGRLRVLVLLRAPLRVLGLGLGLVLGLVRGPVRVRVLGLAQDLLLKPVLAH
jgi:hypothetical protein